MIVERSKPKPREGTWLWLLKIFGGLLIVIVLGIHFFVNHLVAPGGLLSYQDVINYYKVPIVPFMETAFLILVVSHSLIGFRSIILDLNPPDRLLKWIDGVLVFAGLGACAYGVWLVFFLAAR